MNHLRLVQPVDRLGQGVVVTVALAAHRGLDARFCQALAVSNADVLRPSVGMVGQCTIALRLSVVQRLLQPGGRASLSEPVYFWAKAWDKSWIGVWPELGPTRLAFLEYLLIGVASLVAPGLLNREGLARGG